MQQDRKGGKREKKERRKERKKEKGKKEEEKEKKRKKRKKGIFLWNCMASSTSRHEKIRPCRAKRSGASRPNLFGKFGEFLISHTTFTKHALNFKQVS